MDKREHLKLPLYSANIDRKKSGGGGYSKPEARVKNAFSQQAIEKSDELINSFTQLKNKFSGKIDPSLIYEIEINQSVSTEGFEDELLRMGIHVLSVSEGKKGFWIVFNDSNNLDSFKSKLIEYGSENGHEYGFFNAIESFQNIPIEKKIGQSLKDNPLDDKVEYVDIELWRMIDPQSNEKFIQELKNTYASTTFRITDKLITKNFALIRVKLTKQILDEIIEFNEIARVDRPSLPHFNPSEFSSPDISDIEFNQPSNDAMGILVIDSGIISNHPMLEKCIGGEENFQTGETETQDTVGHGTAVAGCVAYGDIENSLEIKSFTPSNWIFSAKVMYAEKDFNSNPIYATYDPEKLIEHQFQEAVESFLSNPSYHIKVINISLGNSSEVWHKHFSRQLPLAALIDELAFKFPHVVFIVSAGNQHPLNIFDSVEEAIDNYPLYLTEHEDFKIINPATSALALTIGSIAQEMRIANGRYGAEDIKTPIAKGHQPSPFTRVGTGINGMIKPELVEYGGNLILSAQYGNISEDIGGKIPLLNNSLGNIVKFDYGTSYSAPKVAHLAGQIANEFPQRSANFIKNMLLVGAEYPFFPDNIFYGSIPKRISEKKFLELLKDIERNLILSNEKDFISSSFYLKKGEKNNYYHLNNISYEDKRKLSSILKDVKFVTSSSIIDHLVVSGYGLSCFDRAIHSFNNRAVLWDEGTIGLNQVKVYSLQLPDIFFQEAGKKKITVVLTFNPETRSTRGDSYLGNRMEFHLFHSINPDILIEKYAEISENKKQINVPKKYKIKFSPTSNIRKVGCHQKAWKEYKSERENRPETPISLVLINSNKWINDDRRMQDYCISVTFEHENEIELYNALRANVQTRTRVR